MTARHILISAALALGAVVGTAAPASAEPATGSCTFTAFNNTQAYRCGSHVLSVNWYGDRNRDEVFWIAPDTRIMHMGSGISPANVSGGKAYTMLRAEVRPTGAHRVYAATAGSRQYYSQNDGGGWSPWYPYTP